MSTTWRGVLYGLDLLKKGLFWQIDNGKSVNIWRDNWLDREPGLKITGKRRQCRLRTVNQLMNEENYTWNVSLLRCVLWEHDEEGILKVRIAGGEHEDVLAWKYEKTGIFLVRSAYRLAVRLQEAEQGLQASSGLPLGDSTVEEHLEAPSTQ